MQFSVPVKHNLCTVRFSSKTKSQKAFPISISHGQFYKVMKISVTLGNGKLAFISSNVTKGTITRGSSLMAFFGRYKWMKFFISSYPDFSIHS